MAKDEVRRIVLVTPDEMVFDMALVIESLRLSPGRLINGEAGTMSIVDNEPPEGIRDLKCRFPFNSMEYGGGLSKDVFSSLVKGDSRSRAMM